MGYAAAGVGCGVPTGGYGFRTSTVIILVLFSWLSLINESAVVGVPSAAFFMKNIPIFRPIMWVSISPSLECIV
jgi:ethanolamine utilization protein EutA (predicted chaperonin)